jgi:type III secretion protein C
LKVVPPFAGAWCRPWRGLCIRARAIGAGSLLLWWACLAQAVPIPFADRSVQLTAREQPVALFLQDLFGLVDVPVSVSPGVKGAVNGSFNGSAERVYRSIARSFGLVEYYDGVVVHVYTPAEMGTRTLSVSPTVAQRVVRNAQEMRLPDGRNTVRQTRDGALVVSGTRRFIEQVDELARAQQAASAAQPPLGFKIFYLRYAWAHDVVLQFGGRQAVVPGVASIVRALMTANPRSQVQVSVPEDPIHRSGPSRLRGQGLALTRNARGGTLGAPDADPGQSSMDAVLAAYAGVTPGGVIQGAAGVAGGETHEPGTAERRMAMALPALMALGDARQVRVEADTRLNAVIVRDAPERIAQYEQLIQALDVEPQSLEIEATIIDVNTDRLRELGINWRLSGDRASMLFGNGTSSDGLLQPGTPVDAITSLAKGGSLSAVLGRDTQFIARITALQEQGAARVVSSPQVITLSNVEAMFDTSKTFYVRVAGRDEVDLFNVSAGTTLRVTPHVFKDGNEVRIKLLVHIDDGALTQQQVDQIPVVERSSIQTQALIFEGESLLIGGLVRETTSDGVTKVPMLGDLPVVGNLFKSSRENRTRMERMFMISPRLVPARRMAAASQQPVAEAPAIAEPAPVATPSVQPLWEVSP